VNNAGFYDIIISVYLSGRRFGWETGLFLAMPPAQTELLEKE
jgi:hypothetical protein